MLIKTASYDNINSILGIDRRYPPTSIQFTFQEEPFKLLNLTYTNGNENVTIHNTYFDGEFKSAFFSRNFEISGHYQTQTTYTTFFNKGEVIAYEDNQGDYYDEQKMSGKCPFISLKDVQHHQSQYLYFVNVIRDYENNYNRHRDYLYIDPYSSPTLREEIMRYSVERDRNVHEQNYLNLFE